MENGVDRAPGSREKSVGPLAHDAWSAVFLTEARVSQHVSATREPGFRLAHNAFGDEVSFDTSADPTRLVKNLETQVAAGERAALLANEDVVVAARPALRQMAKQRLPVVVHLFMVAGADVSFATEALGFGVLLASGVEDSVDLALIARRAAEDASTPFLVVHRAGRGRHLEAVQIPDAELLEAFVGAPSQRIKKWTDPAHPGHAKMSDRAFAERVPFALGSAMRGLEALTGRRHDVLERTSVEAAAVMLVGAGALGDALLGEAERLRAAGHDVGAVKITALRPFPGAQIVRTLARALVVTVLEGIDDPLAQSNPLAREIKSAFADALTWAPGYPGVGRIPRIHSGSVPVEDHSLEPADLDAIVSNMVDGDRGKRLFVYGSDATLALARLGEAAPYAPSRWTMRGVVTGIDAAHACAELGVMVLQSALALKSRVLVHPFEGTDNQTASFEVVAARARPRSPTGPSPLKLVVLDDLRALVEKNPLARVADGSALAVPTQARDGDALWNELPLYVKAIVFDRGMRVIGFPSLPHDSEPERPWQTAAAFAGILLSAFGRTGWDRGDGATMAASIDGSLVEREVTQALTALGVPASRASEYGKVARRAFESPLEVGRATVEKDLAAIGLGRNDARAALAEPR
jgi:pyruvate/2-oxoacid:ferredoxin oxidoreductase alpha subunit